MRTIDAAVGTVGSAAHLGGALHLDVVDHQMVRVQSLVLGVALRVLQQLQQELSRLDGPATLRVAPCLRLKQISKSSTAVYCSFSQPTDRRIVQQFQFNLQTEARILYTE
jgi:hypothetical protein